MFIVHMSAYDDDGGSWSSCVDALQPILDRRLPLLRIDQVEHDQIDRSLRQEERVRRVIDLLASKVPWQTRNRRGEAFRRPDDLLAEAIDAVSSHVRSLLLCLGDA